MRGEAMLPRSTACQPATHLAPARDAPLVISDAYHGEWNYTIKPQR